MKLKAALLLLTSLIMSAPVMAGGNHGHGHSHGAVTPVEAKKLAIQKVRKLTIEGKLESSWAKAEISGFEQKIFNSNPEWVVAFTNSEISDSSKQTLYLFLTLEGRYVAANYTGK